METISQCDRWQCSRNNEIPRTVHLLCPLRPYGKSIVTKYGHVEWFKTYFWGATHYCDMIGLLLNTNWHSSCVQRNLFGTISCCCCCCCYCWEYKHAAYEWKTQTIARSLRMGMRRANIICCPYKCLPKCMVQTNSPVLRPFNGFFVCASSSW